MRRALATALAGLAVTVGLVALAEATQNRPDPATGEGTTELVLEVRTKAADRIEAARSLVAA